MIELQVTPGWLTKARMAIEAPGLTGDDLMSLLGDLISQADSKVAEQGGPFPIVDINIEYITDVDPDSTAEELSECLLEQEHVRAVRVNIREGHLSLPDGCTGYPVEQDGILTAAHDGTTCPVHENAEESPQVSDLDDNDDLQEEIEDEMYAVCAEKGWHWDRERGRILEEATRRVKERRSQ